MNLAEHEIRGWAWNCGAGVLPLFHLALESRDNLAKKEQGIPAIVRQIARQKCNERDAALYLTARGMLEDLALDARAPLVPGHPEIRQYRARYCDDDQPVGG